MKNIFKLIAISILGLASFSSLAAGNTISAWGSTMGEAESKIAQEAEKLGVSYEITSARMGDYSYVTAKLIK